MPDVRLHAFNTTTRHTDFSTQVQLQNLGEDHVLPYPYYLIEHPDALILFDTGLNYEMTQNPEDYGSHGISEEHVLEMIEGYEIDADQQPERQLADVGVSPSEIDYVILSHLHLDHAGNVSSFPDAEFLVQQDELQYAWWPFGIQRDYYLEGDFGILRSPEFDVTELEGECDVMGDGSVVCLPTPGHTPGHQALQIEHEDAGSIILTADLVHHRMAYDEELLTPFDWSAEETVRSIRSIRQRATAEDADVYIHHDMNDFERLPTSARQ